MTDSQLSLNKNLCICVNISISKGTLIAKVEQVSSIQMSVHLQYSDFCGFCMANG